MTEAQLRAAIVAMLHASGWRVFSLPISKLRRPVKDASGYPDLTCARRGRVLWIELKQDNGVISLDQLRWLQELGPAAIVVRPSDLDTEALRMTIA